MQVSKSKQLCNILLDDDVRRGYYGKPSRMVVNNDVKLIKSKKCKMQQGRVELQISIKVEQSLNTNKYYMTVKVNKNRMVKESKVLSNLLALLDNQYDIESLVIECLTK